MRLVQNFTSRHRTLSLSLSLSLFQLTDAVMNLHLDEIAYSILMRHACVTGGAGCVQAQTSLSSICRLYTVGALNFSRQTCQNQAQTDHKYKQWMLYYEYKAPRHRLIEPVFNQHVKSASDGVGYAPLSSYTGCE